MIITCDADTKMGYAYLKPVKNLNKYDSIRNDLQKYIGIETLTIPVYNNFQYEEVFNKMKISKITYMEAMADAGEFVEDYQNDFDDNGYIKGIESDLSKDKFLQLIQENAFQVFKHKWFKNDFIIFTLDKPENVFNIGNTIYPLTNMKDVYVVVHIEGKCRIGFIKAIVSSREDIYPLTYLSKPQFILRDKNL